MTSNFLIKALLGIGFLFSAVPASYAASEPETPAAEETQERESLFPSRNKSLEFSNFTWGADVGASIDLRGYDMSTFDIDAVFGYKDSIVRIAGLGAGIHKSFGSRNTVIPLYAIFRSSFRKKPSPLFLNLQAGYAFSALRESPSRGGIMASAGLGINLAMSKRFQSHIIISYCYYHLNGRTRSEIEIPAKYIDLARISFGVNF